MWQLAEQRGCADTTSLEQFGAELGPYDNSATHTCVRFGCPHVLCDAAAASRLFVAASISMATYSG
jgi:hypothetical protein